MNDTQIEELVSSGIDYPGGVERFGGNAAMYEKFIFRYLDDEHFDLLVQAIDAEDAEEGFRVAHTLKGVVGNLSFAEYFAALDPVTELLRTGEMQQARELLPAVQAAHRAVVNVLSALR